MKKNIKKTVEQDVFINSGEITDEDRKIISKFLKANKKSIYKTKAKSPRKKLKKAA